jgi:MOSC domain-containing protein YiiM
MTAKKHRYFRSWKEILDMGYVASIVIASAPGAPMKRLATAHLVPGKGIEGDRFHTLRNTQTIDEDTICDVTLVEQEAIVALAHTTGEDLRENFARRNIATQGCALAQFVGRVFQIGAVQLQGLKPHEQCKSEDMNQASSCELLQHATLRARILTEGFIAVGDPILLL